MNKKGELSRVPSLPILWGFLREPRKGVEGKERWGFSKFSQGQRLSHSAVSLVLLFLCSLFPLCPLLCYPAKGKAGQWSGELVLSPPTWVGRWVLVNLPSYSLGLELIHCPGLWSPPDWAPSENLQDTERPQKRVRTMFNLEQLEELEKAFAKQHNLVGKNRAQLAARLNLTENQVGTEPSGGPRLHLGTDTTLWKALVVGRKKWAFFCARPLGEAGLINWHTLCMNEKNSPI